MTDIIANSDCRKNIEQLILNCQTVLTRFQRYRSEFEWNEFVKGSCVIFNDSETQINVLVI